MNAQKIEQLIGQYKAEVNYLETQIGDTLKALPAYYVENGPGDPIAKTLAKLLFWNCRLIVVNQRISDLLLEQEGLFPALSEARYQPPQI